MRFGAFSATDNVRELLGGVDAFRIHLETLLKSGSYRVVYADSIRDISDPSLCCIRTAYFPGRANSLIGRSQAYLRSQLKLLKYAPGIGIFRGVCPGLAGFWLYAAGGNCARVSARNRRLWRHEHEP